MIIKNGDKKYEFRMVENENKHGDKSPDFFCFFDIPGTEDANGVCKTLKVSLWKQESKGGKTYYTGMQMKGEEKKEEKKKKSK